MTALKICSLHLNRTHKIQRQFIDVWVLIIIRILIKVNTANSDEIISSHNKCYFHSVFTDLARRHENSSSGLITPIVTDWLTDVLHFNHLHTPWSAHSTFRGRCTQWPALCLLTRTDDLRDNSRLPPRHHLWQAIALSLQQHQAASNSSYL